MPKLRTERLSPRVPGSPRRPNGAGALDDQGYVVINLGGWTNRRLHRLLMEIKLGRPLLPDEDVHHLDGDRQNNQFENLALLTHGEHAHHTNLKFPWLLYCFKCGRPFARRRQRTRAEANFCSKSCANSHASYVRQSKAGKCPAPVRAPIIPLSVFLDRSPFADN